MSETTTEVRPPTTPEAAVSTPTTSSNEFLKRFQASGEGPTPYPWLNKIVGRLTGLFQQ